MSYEMFPLYYSLNLYKISRIYHLNVCYNSQGNCLHLESKLWKDFKITDSNSKIFVWLFFWYNFSSTILLTIYSFYQIIQLYCYIIFHNYHLLLLALSFTSLTLFFRLIELLSTVAILNHLHIYQIWPIFLSSICALF